MWLFCHCHFFWFRKGLIPLAAGIAVESKEDHKLYCGGGKSKKMSLFWCDSASSDFFPDMPRPRPCFLRATREIFFSLSVVTGILNSLHPYLRKFVTYDWEKKDGTNREKSVRVRRTFSPYLDPFRILPHIVCARFPILEMEGFGGPYVLPFPSNGIIFFLNKSRQGVFPPDMNAAKGWLYQFHKKV